jgi:Beta-propeller repeat
MLSLKKVPLAPIFLASILLPFCVIAAQYIPRHRRSQQVQPQNAPVILREVAMTNSEPAKVQDSTRLQVEASYGNLPLSFEPNRGQTDAQVKFLSRAGNRTLWLTSDEAVLAVGRPPRPVGPDTQQAAAAKENQSTPTVLRMKFVGANAHPRIGGEAKQPGTVNYFSGEPNGWRTKIPTYARVRYRSLYPGIDLVFYGNNRELEYDLVVASGADPGQIKLAIAGARNIRIDGEGNLVLETPAGDVIQQKPKIYQRSGTTLKPVSGDYVLTAKNEVGFRLGSYDRRAAVVIDPVLRYSTFLGGIGIDEGSGIAVDSHNRAIVAGQTCSPNFPATGNNTPPVQGACAAFVTKLDFTGSHLVFSTFIAGSNSNPGLALDSADNIYLTGTASSNAFPTTPGAFKTTFGGGDAFVTKLNANGTALVYSTLLGGSGFETGFAIAVDGSGNAYVTGNTGSKDFPTTPGAFQNECNLTSDGRCDTAYVTKLNATGSHLLYSTFLGGHGSQIGLAIAVNRAGNAFVTGGTGASDFPTTAGSAQPVFGGDADVFVVEFSSSGSHLIYSTYLGGNESENGRGIALDQFGNAFVTGLTSSTNFPVKNAFQPQCIPFCSVDGFVTKLNPSGRLVYSTYLGGADSALAIGSGIAVTPDGQAYVAGFTQSSKFPTTQTAFQRVFGGFNDIFLTKFSPTGKLIFSSYLGGNDSDLNPAIALDRDANAYLTGSVDFQTFSLVSTFPVTVGAFQQVPGGRGDAFAAKVVALCALSTVNRSVTICSPGNGSTVKSPVRIIAGTTDVTPVKLTQIYLDGRKIYEAPLSAISVNVPMAGGTRRLTVQGLDTANVFFKKTISVNVSPQ